MKQLKQPIDQIVQAQHGKSSTKTSQRVQIATFAAVLATAAIFSTTSISVNGLSLISEKCDPNKVGPDETTVKGGWQAEMFNGLSFRTCGELFSSIKELKKCLL